MNLLAAFPIGVIPSIMIDTILGIKINTLAIPIPIPRIFSIGCFVKIPRNIPTINPTKHDSPNTPNLLSNQSILISASFNPGILSKILFTSQDSGYINVINENVLHVVPSNPKKSCHFGAITSATNTEIIDNPTVTANPIAALPNNAYASAPGIRK